MSNFTKDFKQPFQLYSEKDKTYLQVRSANSLINKNPLLRLRFVIGTQSVLQKYQRLKPRLKYDSILRFSGWDRS